jgi:hypothetical protein
MRLFVAVILAQARIHSPLYLHSSFRWNDNIVIF